MQCEATAPSKHNYNSPSTASSSITMKINVMFHLDYVLLELRGCVKIGNYHRLNDLQKITTNLNGYYGQLSHFNAQK